MSNLQDNKTDNTKNNIEQHYSKTPTSVNPNVQTHAPTSANPSISTHAPTSANPSAPTSVSTHAPTSANPSVPTHAPTSANPSVQTHAPTSANPSVPTHAPTSVSTQTPTSANPSVSTHAPTSANTSVNPNVQTHAPTSANPSISTHAPTSVNPNVQTHAPTSVNPSVQTHAPTSANPSVSTHAPTSANPNVQSNARLGKGVSASSSVKHSKNKTYSYMYSPNRVMFVLIFTILIISLFCGKSLRVPVMRMENIALKSIVLPLVDRLQIIISEIGLDVYQPLIREKVISKLGLENHPSWETKFYNVEKSNTGDKVAASENTSENTSKNTSENISEKVAASEGTSEGSSKNTSKSTSKNTTDNTTQIIPENKYVPKLTPIPYSESKHYSKTEEGISRVPTGAPYSEANPLKIYFFGDSQTDRLALGFSRLINEDKQVVVSQQCVASSGFIRDEYYSWPNKIVDEMSKNKYDAAVIVIGMNDNIDFLDENGKDVLRRTPKWEEVYSNSVRKVMEPLLASVQKVYWLGMPVTKLPKYNNNLEYMDRIQDKVASEYDPNRVIRVSLKAVFPGIGVKFTDSITLENGKKVALVGSDGLHYTVNGGQYVAQALLNELNNDFNFTTPLPFKLFN